MNNMKKLTPFKYFNLNITAKERLKSMKTDPIFWILCVTLIIILGIINII